MRYIALLGYYIGLLNDCIGLLGDYNDFITAKWIDDQSSANYSSNNAYIAYLYTLHLYRCLDRIFPLFFHCILYN